MNTKHWQITLDDVNNQKRDWAYRYPQFTLNQFPNPFKQKIRGTELLINNEIELTALIIENERLQHLLGLNYLHFYAHYPDIIARINHYNEAIRIELEYDAKNFIMHKHDSSGADLIISFIRQTRDYVIKGIPVWAFYEYRQNNGLSYEFCLTKDVFNQKLFPELPKEEELFDLSRPINYMTRKEGE